ncbi:gamma-glutamylcyclotransferase [Loktanella agnita]|uniref:gamma-glutamylcyclotransferase n=1 Tax=Loktanella agnita TaxID=287097 RepID=UPI003985F73B
MDLFTYGTLMAPELMRAVAGAGPLDPVPATLRDHIVRPVSHDVFPVITPQKEAVVEGILWRGLTSDQIARVDLYETPFGYSPEELAITVSGGDIMARCYMPLSENLPKEGIWSFDDWAAAHLQPSIYAAQELYAHRPLPDPGALRRMWPMIESRAWSRHRATVAPSALRHDAVPGDMRIVAERPPHGSFFRLQGVDVTHRRFDGQRSHVLVREVFLGVDAVILLPYDPVRDKVLLVEQVRMGPAARRDPNPWMLEPIAGIVDARETPEDAAHREAAEEAELTLRHVEKVSAFYCSPGSSTDYFYTYVGLCDLPGSTAYLGGLEEEGEDIRLHPISFDRAMELADTGEIATGPLLFLLNWLARHRDRLRAMA